MPNGDLLAEVGSYDDELTAYLRLEYLKGLKQLSGHALLMNTKEVQGKPSYGLYVVLENNLLKASNEVAKLQIDGFIDSFHMISPPRSQVEGWEKQTRLFEAAYNKPIRKHLLELPHRELTSAVAKFILFKVKTDRRVRERIEPVAKVMSPEESQEFAADMIDVAQFYDLPLAMLLGVGAMENNYLSARGDLDHTVWKRRAQRGDIILKRRRGRVLVSDYSLGSWQITRETLRYVHRLYLEDHRDYSLLPPRLRPPAKLDFENIDAHVLTTYAGLLLRHLLDKFHGDVTKAVGAYNGGPERPNMDYAEGVAMVSKYAHRVLGMAVGAKDKTVGETRLKVAEVRPSAEERISEGKGEIVSAKRTAQH